MKNTKQYLDEYNNILGEEFGHANQKLLKIFLFNLVQKANKDICYRCGNKITKIDDLSIEHIETWLKTENQDYRPELYYQYSNCKFSHINCNCASSKAFTGKSKYVGVDLFLDKRRNYQRWRAIFRVDGKKHCLGYYEKEEDAAEARDLGVIKYGGGKGLLNFPEKIEEYKQKIAEGWGEKPKCKICGGEHYGKGYCMKHHYEFCGGKEKRKQRYQAGKG